jgi:hypothetical protein
MPCVHVHQFTFKSLSNQMAVLNISLSYVLAARPSQRVKIVQLRLCV